MELQIVEQEAVIDRREIATYQEDANHRTSDPQQVLLHKAMTVEQSLERDNGILTRVGSGYTGSQKQLLQQATTRGQSMDHITMETRRAAAPGGEMPQLSESLFEHGSQRSADQYHHLAGGHGFQDHRYNGEQPHHLPRETSRKREFFQEYTSHLRVHSQVNDLCKLKQELQLPQLALKKGQVMADPLEMLKPRGHNRANSSIRSALKNAQSLKGTYHGGEIVDGIVTRDGRNQTQIKQLSQIGTQNYKELISEMGNLRNLTPRLRANSCIRTKMRNVDSQRVDLPGQQTTAWKDSSGSKAGGKVAREGRNQTQIKQLSQRGTQNYKDLLNEMASSRNLMLANTPRQQQLLAMSKGSKTSPRLINRSMLNGSNARLIENRYSKLRNSPSGQTLVHPNSRILDHPANLLGMQTFEDSGISRPLIQAASSLTTALMAKNFILSPDKSLEDTRQRTFDKRSLSLQPAPQLQDAQLTLAQQHRQFLKQDQSAISMKIQEAQMPRDLRDQRPSFSQVAQNAIDIGVNGAQKQEQLPAEIWEQEEKDGSFGGVPENMINAMSSPTQLNQFTMNAPVNITKVRSPRPSQLKDYSSPSVVRSIFNRSGSQDVTMLKDVASQSILLSPQASARTIFGTQKRSEAVASRNVLGQILAKTEADDQNNPQQNHAIANHGGLSTPKQQTSAAKKGKLRALLDSSDKTFGLDKPRTKAEVLELSPKKKVERIEQVVGKPYEERVDQMHQRNSPKPKLRLFVSLKRETHLEEEDTYDWSEEKPYNTEQAFEALQEKDPIPVSKTDERTGLLKSIVQKVENANIHMGQGITQEAKKLSTIVNVLDLQYKYQKDTTTDLGFEKYQVIKEIYKKKQADKKAIEKKNRRADDIAGGDTTTVAQSRMGGESRMDTSEDYRNTTMRADSETFLRPLTLPKNSIEPSTPTVFLDRKTSAIFPLALLGRLEAGDSQTPAVRLTKIEGQEQAEQDFMKKTFNLKKRQHGSDMMLNDLDDVLNQLPVTAGAVDIAVLKNVVLAPNIGSMFNVDEIDQIEEKPEEKKKELRVDSASSFKSKEKSSATLSRNSNEHLDEAEAIPHAKTESMSTLTIAMKKLSSKDLVDKQRARRNTQYISALKGISLEEATKQKSFVQLDFEEPNAQIAEENVSDNSFISDKEEELEGHPLRRMQVKNSKGLKLQQTLTVNSEQSQTLSNPFETQSKNQEEKAINEVSAEETSYMETDSKITTSSVAESRGTTGVHDLHLSETHLGFKVPRKGKFIVLKADLSNVDEIPRRDPKEAYQVDKDQHVTNFVNYCLRDHDGVLVNPYPLLHQIKRGRLLIKRQSWPDEVWTNVFRLALELSRTELGVDYSVRVIYLDQCEIPDKTLAEIIKSLIQFEKLNRLILNKLELGTSTVAALKKLNKSKDMQRTQQEFAMDFRECRLVGFEDKYPGLDIDEHPMLQLQFTPIRNLSLIKANLQDGHISLILNLQKQLELLDISFNCFTTQGLIGLIDEINQGKAHSMSLRSLSLAGNDLNGAEQESYLVNNLDSLIKKTYIQHLDLSLTQLKTSTATVCIKALVGARSIQSLHLSGPKQAKLREVAKKIFGHTLFDETVGSQVSNEISDGWNNEATHNVPQFNTDEIVNNVASSFLGTNTKTERARDLNPALNYSDQRLVFSRLIGHKKLSYHQSWVRRDAVDTFGRPLDIRKTLPEDIQKEIELGKRQPDDLCWVMRQECWICELWTYYMPIFSKQDISESYSDTSSTLLQLNEVQEKIFEKMIQQDNQAYADLKVATPYIIGNMTRHKFIELELFQDHMASVDLEGDKVKTKFDNNKEKMFQYYRQEWASVFKKSSQRHIVGKKKGQIEQKMLGRRVTDGKPGPLYPWRPHTDCSKGKVFSEYDVLYTAAVVAKPGKHSCFLVYKFDQDRVLKAHFSTQIPIRTHQIAHHHVLPRLKKKETFEEEEARRDKNYYFDIFRGFADKQVPEKVKLAMMSDFENWEIAQMPQLLIVGQQGYRKIIEVMLEHANTLLVTFKRLQSTSDSFPALTYKTVSDWANNIGIIDQEYTSAQFMKDYIETKVPDKPRNAKRQFLSPTRKQPSMIMKKVSAMMSFSQKRQQREEEKQQSSRLPTNCLVRHQFMELLVKIAIGRYSKYAERIQPSSCIEQLISQTILKSFKESKVYGNPAQVSQWMKSELFSDRDTQKILFLNQFALKKLFDKLCFEQQQQDAENNVEDDHKQKKRSKSIRRTLSRKLTDLGSINEAPELESSPTKASRTKKPSSSRVIAEQSNLAASKDNNSGSDVDETPKSRMSVQSNQKLQSRTPRARRNSHLTIVTKGLQNNLTVRNSPLLSGGKRDRLDSFQSAAMGATIANTDHEYFGAAGSGGANSSQQSKQKVIGVEFNDTQTSINITTKNLDLNQTSQLDLKLQSGASSTFKASNLKKVNSPTKRGLKLKIQTQFLRKKEKETMIGFDNLFEIVKKVLPKDMLRLVDPVVHKLCFTWALSLQYTCGNTEQSIEMDSKRRKKLNFVEFIVYLCILGKEIEKLQVISGMEAKTIVETISQVYSHFMTAYDLKLEQVPENDTRGLNVFAQDILLKGKVQKYELPPAEKLQESFHGDMFSDSDSEEAMAGRHDGLSGLKKVFKDKWEILQDMKPKKSIQKQEIDPSVPNDELIEKMEKRRARRYELVELKKRMAEAALLSNSDDSDY